MSAVRIAARLLEAWTRAYTLGLPRQARRDRLARIRADIWEQQHDPAGEPSWRLALSLLDRGLRGAPDDLAWRLSDVRRVRRAPVIHLERRPIMAPHPDTSLRIALPTALVASAFAAGLLLQPLAHSLAYAAGGLVVLSLAGWTLEARAAGDDAGPSAWPLLLAAGVALLAAGVLIEGPRAGLFVVLPLAVGAGVAVMRGLAARSEARRAEVAAALVSTETISARAARGDAVALERAQGAGVSRRAVLRGGFGLGLTSFLAAMGGAVVDFLWQRNVSGFGGVVVAGKVVDFPPGTKTRNQPGKFWLVSLTPEQGGPGLLALWQKCPHLGCVVPWEQRFSFVDPESNVRRQGWFRCPCHQSTYNDAGVRVFGPAPRSMDRMAVRVTEDGLVEVDTADISNGTPSNATHAVNPNAAPPEDTARRL